MFAVIGQVFFAWAFADFLSGVFHWFEDRYIRTSWPILGKHVGAPNELHHQQPTAFLYGSYWHRNSTTIIPCMVALLVTIALRGPEWLSWTWIFLSQANEIHAWAHGKGKIPKTPDFVMVLQATGFLQSPLHHAQHHRSPHDVRYCVMSSWINPILDTYGFWPFAERVVSIFGLHPKSDT